MQILLDVFMPVDGPQVIPGRASTNMKYSA
jgi:hypothetical protein